MAPPLVISKVLLLPRTRQLPHNAGGSGGGHPQVGQRRFPGAVGHSDVREVNGQGSGGRSRRMSSRLVLIFAVPWIRPLLDRIISACAAAVPSSAVAARASPRCRAPRMMSDVSHGGLRRPRVWPVRPFPGPCVRCRWRRCRAGRRICRKGTAAASWPVRLRPKRRRARPG